MALHFYLDESVRGDAITVGGFFLHDDAMHEVVAGFQNLKVGLGLSVTDELKHTLGTKEPTRKKLDRLGVYRADYVPIVLDWLAGQPLTVIANTNFPERIDIKPETLYCDALGHSLLRFANHIQYGGLASSGPHTVVVDTPPDQRSKKVSKEIGDRLRSVANAKQAAPRVYAERYRNAFRFPRGSTAPPYRDLGMAPQLLTATAKHSDLLQVADFVAGVANEWVNAYLAEQDVFAEERPRDWRDENLLQILKVANRYRGTTWNFGVMVFPAAWQGFTMRSRIHELEAELVTTR